MNPFFAAAIPQKRYQGRVDLVGAFLLDPMPGAVDDELLLEVGQNPFHVGDALGADQAVMSAATRATVSPT